MSVRIRRIDDHSDEGYIRVVFQTPHIDKFERVITLDGSCLNMSMSETGIDKDDDFEAMRGLLYTLHDFLLLEAMTSDE